MRILFFFLSLCSSLSAYDPTPWFSPLWEIESELSYFFSHGQRVQSPNGSFNYLFNDHELFFSLGTTITPEWNIESDLGFVKMMDQNFLFELLHLRAKKLWLDDVNGDLFTLTTNFSLLFTQKKILEAFEFPYHGYVNSEFQIGIGKEFLNRNSYFWNWRIYSLVAVGIAERGCPWFHAVMGIDKAFTPNTTISFLCEYLQGLGSNDLIPNAPFLGYARIAHQTLYISALYSYEIGVVGCLNFIGFCTLFSRNFPEKIIGGGICLQIPFGL